MNRRVKLLDAVALLEDVQTEEVLLKRGEVGAVVETLTPDVYEVEFCDNQGHATHSSACAVLNCWSCTTKAIARRHKLSPPHRSASAPTPTLARKLLS